jgi:hypothetical protein
MQPRPPDPHFHRFGIGVTAVQCLVVVDEGALPCKQGGLLVSSGSAVNCLSASVYDSRPPKASLIRESGSITTSSSSWAQTPVAQAKVLGRPAGNLCVPCLPGESMRSLGIAIWPGIACPGARAPGASVKGFPVEVVQRGR